MLDQFVIYNDLCTDVEITKEQIKLAEYELEYWFGIKFHDPCLNGIPFGAYGANKFGATTAVVQADKTIDSLNKLKARLETLEGSKKRIETLLGKFERLEYKIAYMRYVEGRTLKEIADELGYSYDYIREVMSRVKKAV